MSKAVVPKVVVAKPKPKKVKNNIYDIIQFKRMLGKDMVRPHGVVQDRKAILEGNKKIRERILQGQIKNVYLQGYVHNGILFIGNIDKLLLIDSLSYNDIKKNAIEFDIHVEQGKDPKD